MAAKKKKATKKKPPHCKSVNKANGKKGKICFDGKGKITSAAKVSAYQKRRKAAKARKAA